MTDVQARLAETLNADPFEPRKPRKPRSDLLRRLVIGLPLVPIVLALVAVAPVLRAAEEALGRKHELPPAPGQRNELFGLHLQPLLLDKHEETFPKMAALGVSWVRVNIHWLKLEPEEGQFDFKSLDALVADAEKNRLKLLLTVRATSPWGSSKVPANAGRKGYHATSPPKDMAQYAAFIRELVGHYKGRGIAWQIENEPNAPAFWDGTQADYVALLKTAHKTAHEADPDCTVVAAGLACGFSHPGGTEDRLKRIGEWANAILDSGAFDAMDVHDFYPAEKNAWNLTFEQYLEAHEAWMKAKNIAKPLWISEVGVNSAPIKIGGDEFKFTPEQQARELEQGYAIAAKHHIVHVFWAFLVDEDQFVFSHMGLSTGAREPKPAFETYRRLATEK
jgi:hypothetical protein